MTERKRIVPSNDALRDQIRRVAAPSDDYQKFTKRMNEHAAEMQAAVRRKDELERQHQETIIKGKASVACAALISQIRFFEASLGDDERIGLSLVAFGNTTIEATKIEYQDPSVVVISGFSAAGNPVRLVQHVSQLNVLLTSFKPEDPPEPRKPIGFGVLQEPSASSNS